MAINPTTSPNLGRPSRGFHLETVLFLLPLSCFFKYKSRTEYGFQKEKDSFVIKGASFVTLSDLSFNSTFAASWVIARPYGVLGSDLAVESSDREFASSVVSQYLARPINDFSLSIANETRSVSTGCATFKPTVITPGDCSLIRAAHGPLLSLITGGRCVRLVLSAYHFVVTSLPDDSHLILAATRCASATFAYIARSGLAHLHAACHAKRCIGCNSCHRFKQLRR